MAEQHSNISNDPNRIYNGFCEPFPNEPTHDKFKLVTTLDKGEGVISLVNFKSGELVYTGTGTKQAQLSLWSLQISPTEFIHDPYITGKLLHSCSPNLVIDVKTQNCYALRDIFPNESITVDYEETEDDLHQEFQCQCKAENCRGIIRGRKYVNKAKEEKSVQEK